MGKNDLFHVIFCQCLQNKLLFVTFHRPKISRAIRFTTTMNHITHKTPKCCNCLHYTTRRLRSSHTTAQIQNFCSGWQSDLLITFVRHKKAYFLLVMLRIVSKQWLLENNISVWGKEVLTREDRYSRTEMRNVSYFDKRKTSSAKKNAKIQS